jgi:hypothetical protein
MIKKIKEIFKKSKYIIIEQENNKNKKNKSFVEKMKDLFRDNSMELLFS